MKVSWEIFVDYYERNIPVLQDIITNLKEGLSVFNKEKDIREFYEACYTGNLISFKFHKIFIRG